MQKTRWITALHESGPQLLGSEVRWCTDNPRGNWSRHEQGARSEILVMCDLPEQAVCHSPLHFHDIPVFIERGRDGESVRNGSDVDEQPVLREVSPRTYSRGIYYISVRTAQRIAAVYLLPKPKMNDAGSGA